MGSITIRVDDETKAQATKIVEDFGFDLSSVTRAFYRQVVRENRIPLNLSYQEPNEASIESLREAREILASGRARFSDSDQVFDALEI